MRHNSIICNVVPKHYNYNVHCDYYFSTQFCITTPVDISKNKFAEIPEDITKCENLEELNCYHNMIRSIDKFNTVSLRFLCKLNLSRNLLSRSELKKGLFNDICNLVCLTPV